MATTKKKRTGLDALGLGTGISPIDTDKKAEKKVTGLRRPANQKIESLSSSNEESQKETKPAKDEVAKTTVYAPRAVFDQWRELAFTERKKMHDYLLEGLDLVFKDRGLKSITELTGKE